MYNKAIKQLFRVHKYATLTTIVLINYFLKLNYVRICNIKKFTNDPKQNNSRAKYINKARSF